MDKKRVFIIVLDGFGIGSLPDADRFGDRGSNTLASAARTNTLDIPNLIDLGLGNIEGVSTIPKAAKPRASFARLAERSMGKDTVTGHWEIAGLITEKAFPTYPDGFPESIIRAFEERTGKQVIVNKPMSGTEVIARYGEEHMRTGALIVYTSADSVFQIAAHEEIVPIEELYRFCEIARDILQGEHGVGRVIARPFIGEAGRFKRTSHRHDYSLPPVGDTMLDRLRRAEKMTIGVGKIHDIFAGRGIGLSYHTEDNQEGMDIAIQLAGEKTGDLIFVNLVDFDMVYGHRNDIEGYARALTEFDRKLGLILRLLQQNDLLIITADHGCDPGFSGTDHTREYVPMIAWGSHVKNGIDLKTRNSFADIAATVTEYLDLESGGDGDSFLGDIKAD